MKLEFEKYLKIMLHEENFSWYKDLILNVCHNTRPTYEVLSVFIWCATLEEKYFILCKCTLLLQPFKIKCLLRFTLYLMVKLNFDTV